MKKTVMLAVALAACGTTGDPAPPQAELTGDVHELVQCITEELRDARLAFNIETRHDDVVVVNGWRYWDDEGFEGPVAAAGRTTSRTRLDVIEALILERSPGTVELQLTSDTRTVSGSRRFGPRPEVARIADGIRRECEG